MDSGAQQKSSFHFAALTTLNALDLPPISASGWIIFDDFDLFPLAELRNFA